MGLKWTDSQRIGEELYDLHGEIHPLSLRFTDLHAMILALEGFDDDPGGSSEGVLEAIQLVWYEEWREDHSDDEDPYLFTRRKH